MVKAFLRLPAGRQMETLMWPFGGNLRGETEVSDSPASDSQYEKN